MDSHTFGLRKEGRKLPSFDPYGQCSKKEERKRKRKEKMRRKCERMRREIRKRKGKERKAKRKEAKRVGEEWRMQWLDVLHFRERVSSFSLEL